MNVAIGTIGQYRYVMKLLAYILFILAISAQAVTAEINETTSRHLRTEYMCRVAMENGLKPVPAELDHFRLTNHYGVADLYGDGTVDFFFGFSDDTFSLDRLRQANETRDTDWPLEMFFDNADRSYRNHQYSFYSPDPEFIVPESTRFLVARTFAVQDYNGDGVDDFAVAHFGRDYEPWDPRSNELLLSGDDGYQFSILPGGQGQNHGAVAGDIDGDGDVDLVISRINPNTILFLENNGEGIFSLRRANGIPRQSSDYDGVTVGLWDVDDDGHLDFVTSRRSDPFDGGIAMIFWGRDGFDFEPEPMVIFSDGLSNTGAMITRNGYQMATAPGVLDFEFADFDGDGDTDIAMVTQSDFYGRWEVSLSEFNGREAVTTVVDQSSDDAFFAIFWINACDLQIDGDIDLVYEHFGQRFHNVWQPDAESNTSRMERYVWLNDGLGKFARFMLESSVYFSPGYHEYLALNAEWLGVAHRGFLPTQSYFPNVQDDTERYFHPFYDMGRPFEGNPYVMVPEIAARFPNLDFSQTYSNSSIANDASQVSARVRAILEARRQAAASDEVSTTTVQTQTRTTPTDSTPPSDSSTSLSPRAQAALEAIIRGEDPHVAIGEVSSPTLPVSSPQSVVKVNDASQVSARVRAILEARRND